MNLSFKDVWLSYFIYKQHLISKMISGNLLTFNGDECLNAQGQSVLKFSKQALALIEDKNNLGYQIKGITVNFIVYWQGDNVENEIKIILPELYFERQ